ncbi:family 1 glycosylhydrolase, partial [Listeria booriae]
MKELLTFPKDFWWGSAWSAEQAEGRGDTGKAKTVWEHWFETEPNRFYEGVGSEITT